MPPRPDASRPPTRASRVLTFVACALLCLVPGMGLSALGADEVHWTITGATSVALDWRGSETSIAYGLTATYGRSVAAVRPMPVPVSSSGPFWEARLSGLQPGTLYHYSIGGGADHTFRTPPSAAQTGFRVNVEGDIGDSTSYANVLPLQRLIAQDAPDFVLALGDLTYANAHGQSAVDQHFNDVMVWSLDSAYMPVWGNHDWESPDTLVNYTGRFDLPNPQTSPGSPTSGGEDWSWFDYGNVRFISYPEPWSGAWSDWASRADAIMDAAQADSAIDFIVTFGHRPAYSSGHHSGDLTLKSYLDSLGATHSKYVLNLNGHSHNYERSYPQSGVVHITAGTGGSSLEEDGNCLWATCTQPSWSAFRVMHHGIVRLDVSAGAIEGAFLCGPAGGGTNDVSCTPGAIIDRFTIGAQASDTTRPSVSLTSPTDGTTVQGSVEITASASDNVGVASVQLYVDGSRLGPELTTSPYTATWDTTSVANGSHKVQATARDAAGNSTTATVFVTVGNSTSTKPRIAMTAPANGATVSGTVDVAANASDDVGVATVQFYLDGARLGSSLTTAPYVLAWDTTLTPDGTHVLQGVARDAAGNSATSLSVTVTVANGAADDVDPTVVLTSPVEGSTLTGSVTIAADASDNVAVEGVQFLLDGMPIGDEDVAPPYALDWNTTSASEGLHSLSAAARDTSGNVGTSPAITVTIRNADVIPPVIVLMSPLDGAIVSGTVTLAADASDNRGVTRVQFLLDGAPLGAEDVAEPFALDWDSTSATNGTHTIQAVVHDAAGNSATSGLVAITVDNSATQPPSLTLIAPAEGSIVSGIVTVEAVASGDQGLAGVQFLLDDAPLGEVVTAPPFVMPWDTAGATPGAHVLSAQARDLTGTLILSPRVTVYVADLVPPTVEITFPGSGAILSKTATLAAAAADNIGVAGVQFLVDGQRIGEEITTAPYSTTWSTRWASKGPHVLTAVARDAAGNLSTSQPVDVTIVRGRVE